MADMKFLTPVRAIRAKCLECCCGSSKEVSLCALKDCPCWPYKNGHRPDKDKKKTNENS